MKNSDSKFVTKAWQQLKHHICEQDSEADIYSMYVCQYCRPILINNKIPSRCILNGLITEPLPAELSNLDALSRQLIQRAKALQTIARLGTYTATHKGQKKWRRFVCMIFLKTMQSAEPTIQDSASIADLRSHASLITGSLILTKRIRGKITSTPCCCCLCLSEMKALCLQKMKLLKKPLIAR